ncbi:hypothetical protein D3C78_927770 [compost metagenome]
MVVVGRNLPHRTREADRQLAGRVVVAEQHVRDGVAAFGATEPGFEDRIGLFVFFENRQWTAVHQHQYQRFAGGLEGLDQVALVARDIQVGAARRLVGHATGFAHGRDDDVSLLRGFHRFVDHDLRRTRVVDHFRGIEVEEVQVVDDFLVRGDVGATGVGQSGLIT